MTPKKLFLLQSVHKFRNENNGMNPTIRDLQSMTGLSSTSVVSYHIEPLVAGGYLSRIPRLARSIIVTRKGLDYLESRGELNDQVQQN